MATDCYSLLLLGIFLLSFSCGARGGRDSISLGEKNSYINDSGHVAPLYPNFTTLFSSAKNSGSRRVLFALTYVQDTGPFVGGSGDIVVWDESVQPNDRSFTVVGCLATQITIYAGYGVFPDHYGDTKSRIFITTVIKGVECFNDAKCMNFVQVNSSYQLGGILDVSVDNDPSKNQILHVSLDKEGDKWWVSFNNERFGYFDSFIMERMKCRAILWGGIVVWDGNKATATQMGNGYFPKNNAMNCGIIYNAFASTVDGFTEEKPIDPVVTNPACYDFVQTSNSEFHFGGSGSLNSGCS